MTQLQRDPAEILKELRAPFDPRAISWRVGSTNGDKTSGLALPYIDARDVMDRLDAVMGPDNWQDSYTETPRGRVVCQLSMRINGEWVAKSDGAGDTDVEGEKGGISDAFKRAAVKWGIGRYLYDLGNIWADIVPMGPKSHKFKNPEQLASKLPAWARPDVTEPTALERAAGWYAIPANSAKIKAAGLTQQWDAAIAELSALAKSAVKQKQQE